MDWKNHDLPGGLISGQVRYEERPVRDAAGHVVDGLHALWIVLDNPAQLNSYTTDMVKDVIAAFRRASNDRRAVGVVFTGSGERAFCTGGNVKEYAEYYAGRPAEYMQYMRLFNDMVTAILHCDLPVICRVNGMRIAGGQEIGMACDLTVSSDLARFGQAGPKHGSAPDGGSTDFLPLFVGIENAMDSCTLCEHWSAYRAKQLGLIHTVVPVLELEGSVIANPLVVTDRWIDTRGAMVYGDFLSGAAADQGKAVMARAKVNLAHLDRAVDSLLTKFMLTMPGCTTKTVQSVRKHKLEHWDRNRETNRQWLGLNMMTEARAGFRAFNEGTGREREADFIKLRLALADGVPWSDELTSSVLPSARKPETKA